MALIKFLRCPLYLAVLFLLGTTAAVNTAIYSVPSQTEGENNIALTFDDGPHGTLTPRLLNTLKQYNASATFYVMGIKVAKHESIITRAVSEGHEIANHVWNHPVLTKISFDAVYDQLLRTNIAIQSIQNFAPKTMRPPYGNTNKNLNSYITEKGNLSVVMWSLDTLDWRRPTPQSIVDLALKKVKKGDIILCHDIHPGTIEVSRTNCANEISNHKNNPTNAHLTFKIQQLAYFAF